MRMAIATLQEKTARNFQGGIYLAELMTPRDASQITRYLRQIIILEIGLEGQERLLNAKVRVIDAGGLDCPVLLCLAAVGVGHIGIIDFDEIDISNLQRQVLFTEDNVGKSKVNCAAAKR